MIFREPAMCFPLLGLDISEQRIGVAIIDAPNALPQALFTYSRRTRARDLIKCAEWVHQYQVGAVIIGLPLNMDGTPGPRAQWMERFARELRERLAVPVIPHDERLTTVEAEEMLLDQGLDRRARDERRDAVAAAIILQRYLAGDAGGTAPGSGA